ncbi:GIY-YIG nuclease family protein [Fulvivirga lutimaris]|uniref:GIY-YIG nuclease family protein n=1 Tax=Fulvivirga lutimaris TaxID=1819566 RepID=UPI0012BC584F|nr:GIY-YIG nuclease family protein [Fulvivirga lutimaris]MTI40956.1 GIY-YIG nuclease family protein [Fulvivirga lutimaris]
MSHFVYIIYSPKRNRYYVGQTQHLEKRLFDHNNSRSKYTKGTSDWELKWSQEVIDRSEALRLEKQIKSKKSRNYIEFLIDSAS